MSDWRDAIVAEWERRHAAQRPGHAFPLLNQGFDAREIVAAVDTLLDGQLTMASNVRDFERRFAEVVGAPYAVMVNSGSSANLLAVAAATNPARKGHLKSGDEVLVPAVCWATSLWPLIQFGLRPVLVDVDPRTLNISIEDLRRRITTRTRAILAVHVLGNSCPMAELLAVAAKHHLLLIEDTCESLGTLADGRWLGTLGDFGTYSFYYSHHITTGEGGMVVCRDAADYDLLKCLRAHGWTRELSNRAAVEADHPHIDPRFCFVNAGFNLRPLEVQGSFGLCQIERLTSMNHARNENRARLIAAVMGDRRWDGQYTFAEPPPGTEPAWFGLTLLLADRYRSRRGDILVDLSRRGIENRPIISGNFARQPGLALVGLNVDPSTLPGAEEIDERGFFIGIHTRTLEEATVQWVARSLLDVLA